jgi:hypothetical protein
VWHTLLPDTFGALALLFQVEETSFQEVFDPQGYLVLIEGLGQEFLGPGRQGPAPGFAGHVGRKHQDGQVLSGGDMREELFHNPHAIQVGHHQVQQDQVRFVFLENFDHPPGIGQAPQVVITSVLQDVFQQQEVGLLVIHHQNSGAVQVYGGHGLGFGLFRLKKAAINRRTPKGSAGPVNGGLENSFLTPEPRPGAKPGTGE